MDFLPVILFLISYYLRPQEWSAMFARIHFVQLSMMLAIAALFMRDRGFRFGSLLRTPHDWMMFAFLGWTVVASPTPVATLEAVFPFAMFYIVIVQTLTTVPRMNRFFRWWTALIVVVAALAILSEYGFDPLGSYDLTHGRMKDRLALNLSIFKNPNALGHNVVPAIAMLYFVCVWKRPLFIKEVGFALALIPMYCIWLTVSKGAFLCAGATILASQTFGRPRIVQIALVVAALLFGGTILWSLPRMGELERTRSDEAIMGRVAAFTHGMEMIQTKTFGVGHGNWLVSFKEANKYSKAAHSSYVQIGAELGKTGFFLFLGILYCCIRTIVTVKTRTDEEERVRRILFVLVFSYMASSWMVDFGYRPTFFLLAGAVAALHRHLAGMYAEDEKREEEQAAPPIPAWRARLLPQPAVTAALPDGSTAPVLTLEPLQKTTLPRTYAGPSAARAPQPDEPDAAPPAWKRIGLLDLIATGILFWGAMKVWQYAVAHM